jgi:hypothetical protein
LEELVIVVRGGGAIAFPSPALAPVDIEQGIAMDGNELGDLGDILND